MFGYLRDMGQAGCTLGQLQKTLDKCGHAGNATAMRQCVVDELIPSLSVLSANLQNLSNHLAETISTTGALGSMTNFQQHSLPTVLNDTVDVIKVCTCMTRKVFYLKLAF